MATRIVLAKHNMIEPRNHVIEKLRRQRQEIVLIQLSDGHFLYPEANLVFHQRTRRVFCRHEGDASDGKPKSYATLRESDIVFCKRYKLPYDIPEQPVQDVSGDAGTGDDGTGDAGSDDEDDDGSDDDEDDDGGI